MATALMSDGVVEGSNWGRTLLLCAEDSLEMDEFVDESDEIQAAIFSLEAWSEWWRGGGYIGIDGLPCLGPLARAAADEIVKNPPPPVLIWEDYLEAAARLRDGWRPKGWKE